MEHRILHQPPPQDTAALSDEVLRYLAPISPEAKRELIRRWEREAAAQKRRARFASLTPRAKHIRALAHLGMAAVARAHRTGDAEIIASVESSALIGADRIGKAIDADPCAVHGHDYGNVVYLSPSVLHCCQRCGRDIHGRTAKDLEPLTEADREFLERECLEA